MLSRPSIIQKKLITGKYCDSFEFCGCGEGTVVDGGGTLVCGGSVCSDCWRGVGLII